GELTVYELGPELPAAITYRVPYWAVSSLTAWLSGSVPSVAPPPRLMFTTRAPETAAHSIPSRMALFGQLPPSLQTLPISRSAPGATPGRSPFDAAPVPAMVAATWVPCPWPSTTP